MTALSLTAANCAVLTRAPSRIGAGLLHEPLELVDLGGEVTAGAAVEPGQLDHGTPGSWLAVVVLGTADPHPEPARPDEQRAHQPEDAEQHAAERDALAGAVADLQLDPPLHAVEADRPLAVRQLHGLPRGQLDALRRRRDDASAFWKAFSLDLSSS